MEASTRKLLVVSNDDLEGRIVQLLRHRDWRLVYARNAAEAQSLNGRDQFLVGIVVFPRNEAVCRECEQAVASLSDVRWIAILEQGAVAREATKRLIAERLHDFQTLPINIERLSIVLGHAYGVARLERELRESAQLVATGRFGMIGDSPVMRNLYRVVQRAADTDMPVLITGQTGTGKEMVARAIHSTSSRASGPFVALNCSAIPASLIQSELFGHEKGAFTDAFERKIGHIESAAGGTLLLDEIGDMPLEAQSTLLRFLEDKIVARLGGTGTRRVDVRVIASTNKDLKRAIETRHFRLDLYHRLAVLTVRVPDLHSRDGDVEILAKHFLGEAVKATRSSIVGFTKSALDLLRRHDWPGNVRELRARVFQAAVLCKGRYVTRGDLNISGPPTVAIAATLKDALEDTERLILLSTLTRNQWNVSQAARDLGISRMTLYRLMAKHSVAREGEEAAPQAGRKR